MYPSSLSARITLLALLSASTFYFIYKSRRRRLVSFNPNGDGGGGGGGGDGDALSRRRGKLFFISETGTSRALARRLFSRLASDGLPFDLVDPQRYEPEDLSKESLVLMVASTWEDGKPPENGRFLANWLGESAADFRVGALLLSRCKFAVFGVGSGAYGAHFNAVAKDLSVKMRALGAGEIMPLSLGDVDKGDVDGVFDIWSERLIAVLKGGEDRNVILENGVGIGGDSENGSDGGFESDEDEESGGETVVVDLEDIAGKGPSRKSGAVAQINGKANGTREMVTPVIRTSLEKQGYKIIGSHSGVKICRWTKSQLRGRGGCYKHSFYGIESHSWQWKMDDPLEIVDTAIELHTKMIKQMKGVPGVTQERLSEGLSPRHCALSLVGEPIMYPEINALVDELHRRHISTFLVTNAQFPEKIKMLKPVTQLYVSVDAATKESLKAIDRPLFGDFWERFIDSLRELKDKQQRTVYRLTLVKGWNIEDIDAYSNLFSIGKPDFVEIKGVTYCGSSATSKLTMENVPWHSDVKAFSEALALRSNGEYEVACEHVHSCCILLAKTDRFKVDGQWFTWIDYEKFQELVASGKPFDSRDYMAATPSWAVYGADEGGFDPDQLRYRKERHHKTKR
ncbi:hypothetical protein BT93_F1509 [Corymbia citriodora subsp. variegata]|nr:hypothetical protein BT93_F1509 [Corymbia citriodora subsp. variegata]